MQAAVLWQIGQPLGWRDMPVPAPERGELLVEVHACGIDGTDLKLVDGFGYEPELPFVPGHEIAGRVAAHGPGVSEPALDSPVVVYNFETCGACIMCRSHRNQLCLNMGSVMGVLGADGGMAEYVRVKADQAVPIAPDLAFVDGAVCCDAGMTAWHAVERARIRAGETVLIIGVGGVGSFAVQLVRRLGACPIAVELGPAKRAWARALGAEHALEGAETAWSEALRGLGLDHGVDCVLDIVGTRGTMRAGLDALRPGGRFVLVGYTADDLSQAARTLAQRELAILGTRAGTRQDLQRVSALMAQGELQSIVTETYPMREVNAALEALRTGQINGRIALLSPHGAV